MGHRSEGSLEKSQLGILPIVFIELFFRLTLVLNEAIYLGRGLPLDLRPFAIILMDFSGSKFGYSLDIIRSYRMQVLPSHHRTLCGDCHIPQ